MFELRFYALDGASVREGEFETLDAAIDRWADIGSRWIFYPVGAIFKDGKLIEQGDPPLFELGCNELEFTQAVINEAEFLQAILEG